MALPRITFGIIVLNGEPFTRYTLRALYPFAHEIIVVEGAAPGAAQVATPEGHSRDGTLEVLRRFQAEEDPAGKLQIVTQDGFWAEKDAMSQAYAERATGDYLWQVDIDEFYRPEDMQRVVEMLQADPSITAVSFNMRTFWGSPGVITDGWYLRRGAAVYHRLFKWGPGCRYVTHRPPTVHDEAGRDARSLNWLGGDAMQQHGVTMYHYSLLLPKQVLEKCAYYSQAEWAQRQGALEWAERAFLRLERPYRVHNVYDYPSWLEPFTGAHPPQAAALWEDIHQGRLTVETRPMDDVERLLRSPAYQLGRVFLKVWDYVDRFGRWVHQSARRVYHRLRHIRHD